MSYPTYFVARLRCVTCHSWSDDTTRTEMSSKLLDAFDQTVLRVGDRVGATLADFRMAFLNLREPRADEPIRVLHTWQCPTCGALGWAVLVIEDDVFRSAEAVRLSRSTLDSVHFVDETLYQYFEQITGRPLLLGEEIRPDLWEVLRESLPDDSPASRKSGE